MGLVAQVEAVQQCHQELVELSLTLLLATREQVDQRGPQREEAGDLHPAGLVSTALTAGALVALRHQSLVMSLVPGSPLLWPAWFTGTFTGRTGVDVGRGLTATVVAGLRTQRTHEIPLLRDWQAKRPVLHVPTVGQALAAALPVQTQSAVPAAVRVAGE